MRHLVPLLFAAAPALAQGADRASADLDGDGVAEIFTLTVEADAATLVLDPGGARRSYPDIVWSGAMAGTVPHLEIAPNGSVLLISGNEAIGRDRWRQTLTIAYRQGDWRVAGFTYAWSDTLDPGSAGGCDLNLLTGSGTVTAGSGTREVRPTIGALPLAAWTRETMPGECLPKN